MKPLFAGLLLIAACAAWSCAPMGTTASLQVSSAPPPPALEFSSDPQFTYLSDLRLSVIADNSFGYDMFRYGGSYYLYTDGSWYRGASPRGPFVACEARRVPKRIFAVNDHQYHWRHHPQGWRGDHQPGDHDDHHRGDDRGNGH